MVFGTTETAMSSRQQQMLLVVITIAGLGTLVAAVACAVLVT